MDRQPNENKPTCKQIDRACRLYEAGASSQDFKAAFIGELTDYQTLPVGVTAPLAKAAIAAVGC